MMRSDDQTWWSTITNIVFEELFWLNQWVEGVMEKVSKTIVSVLFSYWWGRKIRLGDQPSLTLCLRSFFAKSMGRESWEKWAKPSLAYRFRFSCSRRIEKNVERQRTSGIVRSGHQDWWDQEFGSGLMSLRIIRGSRLIRLSQRTRGS